ncbi:MAG: Gfo/Idh/MocA family oxidoreductase [Pirellulales bacterium]|nr:Gfo/Idh/MocA family oxidoreductase [Pirellulales bacterium]
MSKIRTAVVGAGRLGGFHALKLYQNPHVELVAVADPFAPNRHRVASECFCESLPDHRGLLGRIDAAIIATPTGLHYDLAKQLLEAGVHLLVEKPLCNDSADADALVALARRKNLVLQVGHVERFNPAFAAAAESIQSPKYIDAVRASAYTFRSTDVGAVLDLMIHDIDLVLSLVKSRVRSVEALGASVVGGHEDVANARIAFECGCVANLSASRVSYEAVRRMQLWSLQGFGSIDFANRSLSVVRPSDALLRREFDVDLLAPEEIERQRKSFAGEHLPREERQFDAVDALALEVQDFIDSIQNRRDPRVTGEAGRDAVSLAEEILDRIHDHAWDSSQDGPAGPRALPRRHTIPAPHFTLPSRRVAG